jgi:hypothetical protein
VVDEEETKKPHNKTPIKTGISTTNDKFDKILPPVDSSINNEN